jgi:hypothetical protein
VSPTEEATGSPSPAGLIPSEFPKRMDRAARDYSIKRVQASIEETRKMGVTVPEPTEFQKVVYNDENRHIIPARKLCSCRSERLSPYKGASLAEYASMYERVSITHSINNPGIGQSESLKLSVSKETNKTPTNMI